MKIHRMDIKECERFPNPIAFDFTNEDGKVYSEIIFAGDNGIGKTVILNLISQAIQWNELSQTKNNSRNFIGARYTLTISFTDLEVQLLLSTQSTLLETVLNGRNSEEELYLLDINTLSPVNERLSLLHALDSEGKTIATRHHNIQGVDNPAWSSYVRALYMPPEIQFSGQPIIDTKNNRMDDKAGVTKFTANQTQTIKQMLVDVSIGDGSSINEELNELNEKDISPEDFKKQFISLNLNSRISRFKKAFNDFFDTLQFVSVTNRKC